MSNTILVTGASGNIGRELVAALKAAQATFLTASASGKTVDGVASRHVDFDDVTGMAKAFAGIDTLFLLLPLVQDKLQWARNAVAAAQQAGVKHIVRSSGAGADPAAPFALPRLQGEIDQLVIDSGIAYTLLRPNNFMQNFATYQRDQVKSGTVYLPYGEGKVAYVDTRDIAAVAATVLMNPSQHVGQIYTLTGGEALDTQAMLDLIGAASGRTARYVPVTDEAATASMRSAGMPEWLIDMFAGLNSIIRAGYAAGVSPAVETLLGRAPISAARFAADFADTWR